MEAVKRAGYVTMTSWEAIVRTIDCIVFEEGKFQWFWTRQVCFCIVTKQRLDPISQRRRVPDGGANSRYG